MIAYALGFIWETRDEERLRAVTSEDRELSDGDLRSAAFGLWAEVKAYNSGIVELRYNVRGSRSKSTGSYLTTCSNMDNCGFQLVVGN